MNKNGTVSAQSPLHEIASRFSASMIAMRHFAEHLGPLADQHDAQSSKENLLECFQRMGLKPPPALLGESGALNVEIRLTQSGEDGLVVPSNDSAHRTMVPADRFYSAMNGLRRRLTSHGVILRTSGLIQTVCMLDALVADLLRAYYTMRPGALDGDEGRISFRDLNELGSIDTARELILEQRIDALLRGSILNQLEFFTKSLKVNLKYLNEWLARLNETVQRRHLWVHNSGRVSKLYMARVSPELLAEVGAKEGETLKVDQVYLRRAIDRVNLAGVVLAQQCWRHWVPSEKAQADASLNEAIFDTVCDSRFVAAQFLGKFACEVVESSDMAKRTRFLTMPKD
ncbi:MAG: hypothetical protein QM783_12735 [Phycisphaerales bacterium]